MTIRQENPSDYDEVYELVKKSFSTTSNDYEWDYLNDLRKKDTFIPELSLVAENDDKKIIGQIVLYKMTVNIINNNIIDKKLTELLLSPISVHPDYFRRGIARAMILESFKIAKELGYKAVFLCGEPKLYKKLGFKPSYEYNIFHINDESKRAEWCMACELIEGALKGISGTIDIV